MKIKILHVTQSLGGVKTYLESVFSNSDSSNFEYVIVAPEHYEFQEFCKAHEVTYYPIKIQRSINPFKDVAAFFKILSILKREKPAIIHTHSAKGGFLGRLAAKFTDAKVIYAPHAFSYLSFKGLKRTIFYSLEYMARNWTDILLSVSYSEANRAIYEVDYDKDQVKTILNAVPVAETLPFRNYKSCINIGMIGRLTYQKNPLQYLEIAATLIKTNPQLHFSILGAGLCDHLADEMIDFIKTNNLSDKISILPWGDGDTSKIFLSNMDIFVMTSVFEGLPYSLIEAMAMGIPSVVSKVDGNTDVIQNYENGFACLHADEFCEKISLLVEREDIRRRFGQAGYRYVKEMHNIKTNISQLEDLYTQLAYREGSIRINKLRKSVPQQHKELVHLKVSPGI